MNKIKYPKDEKHYLIYVEKFSMSVSVRKHTIVYEYVGDPFHAMGEINYDSNEPIYSMTFFEDTPQAREYWKNKGIKIKPWINKY